MTKILTLDQNQQGRKQWIRDHPETGLVFRCSGYYRVLSGLDAVKLQQDTEWSKVIMMRKTGGTAGSTISDIHKNGVSIFTTQANRPEIAYNAADNYATDATPDVLSGVAGDILTLEIDQVDGGAPEDLVVQVY